MVSSHFSHNPLFQSLKYGFLSLIFSHLPILFIYIVQWVLDKSLPSFSFVFDSGRLMAIWIPILGMLLISFYEVREFKIHPFVEELSFVLVLLLFIFLTILYTCFFYLKYEYANWMRLMSIIVVVLLFVFLVYSKYLECSASGDLQRARAKDQNTLDQKLSNLK